MSDLDNIIFGLSRDQDEQALSIFLQRFSHNTLLQTLIPRMNQAEIESMLDLLSSLMRKYLSHEEYHRLFLDQE